MNASDTVSQDLKDSLAKLDQFATEQQRQEQTRDDESDMLRGSDVAYSWSNHTTQTGERTNA